MTVNPQIDLYTPQQEEILLFEDGILVKRQKSEREPRTESKKSNKKLAKQGQPKKDYQTDVVLLQKAQGGYEYLTTLIDAQGKVILSLEQVIKALGGARIWLRHNCSPLEFSSNCRWSQIDSLPIRIRVWGASNNYS